MIQYVKIKLRFNRYLKHPSEVLAVGDIVDVVVLSADEKRGRISLSIKQAQN